MVESTMTDAVLLVMAELGGTVIAVIDEQDRDLVRRRHVRLALSAAKPRPRKRPDNSKEAASADGGLW